MKTLYIWRSLLYCLSLSIGLLTLNSNEAQAFKKDKWKITLEEDYDQLWAKVDSLNQAQLPKSALELVNQIYDKAKTEDNHGQLVKAVIHKLKYVVYVEENDLVKSLNDLRKEAETAKFPVKPMLHSMMGEIYWQYYQINRWRFTNRTATVDFKQDDIETWDLRKITEETMRQYQLSLENPDKLQEIKTDVYHVIIRHGTPQEKSYRPTLYDFLAHRAINFFQSSEPDLTKPAYQFTINQEAFLAEAKSFAQLNITTPDSLAYKFYMLRILQDLTKFHLQDETPEALVDVDLKRLLFIYENINLENKDALLMQALEQLEASCIKQDISTLVSHQIARLIKKQGDAYQPLRGDDNKWQYKKALEYAQKAIERFPKSSGAIACQNLIKEIKTKELRLEMVEVNLPNKPFLSYVRYKNIDKLYWKVIKTDLKEIEEFYRKSSRKPNYRAEELHRYLAKKALHEWTTELPNDGDYQYHSVEAKIPALPFGKYIILVSPDPGFSTENNAIAYEYTDISNIAYMHRSNQEKGSTSFYIKHRETGKALSNVEAQVWFQVYNYKKGEYEVLDGGKYRSDAEGFFEIPYQNQEKRRSFYVDFSYGEDQLSTRDAGDYGYDTQFGNYRYTYEKRKSLRTSFFLDRKIYRPGQTVYFKGLVLETDGEKHQIKADYSTTVYFYDVNSQKVGEMKVTTNAYGTFQGKFTAPSSGLTGQMRLQEENGIVYFSVEEYKRPKFEVKFDPIKEAFELNEDITAVGKAKAFSGANIDGATVKYRVVRRARFPRWYYYWYGGGDTSPEMEITNGVTETDENGQFKVKFKAIPDPNISPSSSPTFTYTVYADITDLNGETRSGNTNVAVAYQSLLVSVEIPEELDRNQEITEFQIATTNLSGEFIAAQGSISVHQLQAPAQAYRSRPWQQPDKFLYTEEEFRKDFPKDLYKNENNFYEWEKTKQVLNINFDTGKEKNLNIANLRNWTTGKYVLEIKSKDKKGKEVKEIAYFTVFDINAKKIALPEVNYFQMLKAYGEPGEYINLLIGSSEENLEILYEIEHKGEIIEKKWLKLSKEQKMLSIPIMEDYRGNFGLHYTFIKDNRLYKQDRTLIVPWSNKELKISFETFRNKLMPGQEEEWKIKISGPRGDALAAEMVATLYDASLDVFKKNSFDFSLYQSSYVRLDWSSTNGFDDIGFSLYQNEWNARSASLPYKSYDALNWFGYSYSTMYYNFAYRDYEEDEVLSEVVVTGHNNNSNKQSRRERRGAPAPTSAPPPAKMEQKEAEEATAEEALLTVDKKSVADSTITASEDSEEDLSGVKVRTNFNETAFFQPELQTDSEGNIIIKFTIPEALTRWKMLGFAHTKDLKYGFIENELVTQKDLMVIPNAPRFFRENDKMTFPSKITNLSEKDLEGTAQLLLFDALTMKPIDKQLNNKQKQQKFTVKAGQSTALAWEIDIPVTYQAITYRVVAKAGDFSDGEEMTLPVLTNSMLVTETMPLPIRSNQTKTFELEKLTASNKSSTLRNHRLTLEFTSNPAWYAVQALPYLMEFPHECAEQTFSRYYSNVLASHIANSSPKIKEVFEAWKNLQPDALLSNLEKNQELKSLVISETPWLLQAKDESERKRRIGVLFDLTRMANEMDKALNKLIKKQRSSGGWSWFEGMKEDRYITQHIATGMGHLDHLGIKSIRNNPRAWQMTRKAIGFLDRKMQEDYEYLQMLEKRGDIKMKEDHLSYLNVQYLYARSFFKEDFKLESRYQEAFDYFFGQAQKYWTSRGIYMQGMIALFTHRYEDNKTPQNIVKSLRERALHSEEMGMYWKQTGGYYWYQAPIETQSLLVEVFDEVADDTKAVDDLKTWLLKQKQTQDWKTTKATAEACYALMLRGSNWLVNEALVEITIGSKTINPSSEDSPIAVEKGTGYFKTSWEAEDISADMGKVTVAKKDEGVAWGALYWQYFEQLDKITPAETPLKLKKQLFLEKDSDKGKVLTPIKVGTKLKVGDLVKVRIELRVDRLMEYVHMKDMRASGFEPINVLSQYKYQDGLGYYESTKDAATHFFFGVLPKGTFVFEYPLRVTHEGDFSNGVTSIQCMYAPEFASHSEGVRVKVVEKK